MTEICGDNRFEVIAKAKEHLLEATNIDTSEDEMKVLDNFLFRCWQMGWLDRYDEQKKGEWIEGKYDLMCSNCENTQEYEKFPYCPYCGADMRAEQTEPQTDIHDLTDCVFCKDRNCKDCKGSKDEPQTERSE